MKALLLDLDDTLLQTHLEEFLPLYLSRLAAELNGYGSSDEIIAKLTEATRAMITNLDPIRTLKQTFDAHFYPALGVTEADLRPTVDRFYKEIYPELRSLTAPVPGARDLVDAAADAGMDIAIATNPLFPEHAMIQRLEWAGLDGSRQDFSLVTSYEKFHFAKPQPEYYAEILGLLGVPPEQSAMIGDSLENDLNPARLLGLSVYHRSTDPGPDTAGGDLAGARSWALRLGQADDSGSTPGPPSPRAVLARLRGHLAALLHYADGKMDASWGERPSAREWAPHEVVCYLRDRELEVCQPGLQRLLDEEAPFLPAADSQAWPEDRAYLQQDLRAALEAFVDARQRTIARLSGLSEEDWSRPGRHALLGSITLATWLDSAADHELEQLARVRHLYHVL